MKTIIFVALFCLIISNAFLIGNGSNKDEAEDFKQFFRAYKKTVTGSDLTDSIACLKGSGPGAFLSYYSGLAFTVSISTKTLVSTSC